MSVFPEQHIKTPHHRWPAGRGSEGEAVGAARHRDLSGLGGLSGRPMHRLPVWYSAGRKANVKNHSLGTTAHSHQTTLSPNLQATAPIQH
eukprot:7826426-Alexandrium_andersonii.AAC.1